MALMKLKDAIKISSLHEFIIDYKEDDRFSDAIEQWEEHINRRNIYIDDILENRDKIDDYFMFVYDEIAYILKKSNGTFLLDSNYIDGYIIYELSNEIIK